MIIRLARIKCPHCEKKITVRDTSDSLSAEKDAEEMLEDAIDNLDAVMDRMGKRFKDINASIKHIFGKPLG